MGSNTDNVVNSVGNINNQFRLNLENICMASCQAQNFDQTVIISGTNIGGSVNFNQECSANAYCSINSNLAYAANIISNNLGSYTWTMDKPSIWSYEISDAENNANIQETIQNSLSVSHSNLCTATNTLLQAKNITYLQNSNIPGPVVFSSQTGSAQASCTMNNISKTVALTCNQANVDVQEGINNGFLIGLIIIIVSIIIATLIIFIFLSGVGNSSKTTTNLSPQQKINKVKEQQQLLDKEFKEPISLKIK